MRNNVDFLSHSAEETLSSGKQFGKEIPAKCVIALLGDLGAGKTTFVKGLVEGATGVSSREVNSPTFVYLNIYSGKNTLYHFDLYRLQSQQDFLALGFDEYFEKESICCVEWAQKISPLLPQDTIFVELAHAEDGKRRIHIRREL